MVEPTRFSGPVHFRDDVVFGKSAALPAGSITAAMIAAGAGLPAATLEHQHAETLAQQTDETARAEKRIIYSAYGATGTVVTFEAGCAVLCTSTATIDVDLLKNGTSILSSAISLDSADTVYGPVTASVSTSAYVDGDVFEVVITPHGPDTPDFEYEEHFLLDAGDTLPALWAIDTSSANSTEDYVTDQPNGVYTLTQEGTSEAQNAQLFTSNNLWIDLFERPIIEWRARLNLTGTNSLGSADQRLVLGVCSDHTNAEDDLDAVATSAWFRMEGTSANILVETDDASTNADDIDSGVDLVDNTWTHFKIDFSDLSAVKFYVDGVLSTGQTMDMSNISSSTMVQPIACIQRDAGAEAEIVYLDSFDIRSGAALGTLGKGVFATLHRREDAA